MTNFKKYRLRVAVAAIAVLIGVASATTAGLDGTTLIAKGYALVEDAELFEVTTGKVTVIERRHLVFGIRKMLDGTMEGWGIIGTSAGTVHFFDVNSHATDSDGVLWMAGPVTWTNDDGATGRLLMTGVKDNGSGPDEIYFSVVLVPSFWGTSLDDVQSVLAALGLPDTPDSFKILFTILGLDLVEIDGGNIWIG